MSFCIVRILIRTVIQQSNNENVYLRDKISRAQDGFLLGHNFLIMVRFTLLFTLLVLVFRYIVSEACLPHSDIVTFYIRFMKNFIVNGHVEII